MDLKETGKKLKPFAPVLSVAVVASCVAGSLGGYQPPVYAAQEQTDFVKEETTKSEEQAQVAKGSFDLTDGVYKGTGTGYAGDITVAVQIKDKQIVAIDILSSSDDAAFFKRAQAVIDKIIEGQTLDVDTVSGATYSSRGIISAVKNALTGEKDSGTTGQSQSGSGAAAGSSTSVQAVEDPSAYKDGTYYGTGTGFGGTLKVKVEISGGKITSIQIMENQDGSEYISKASALINTIIQNQSTNVDTVSGATYSSVGIIQAVRNALSQAAVSTSGTTTSGEAGNAGNSGNQNQDTSAATGNFPYKEGIYYGTAEGYSGDVSVAVVIQEKSIKAILITETSDDEAFFQRAMGVVKNVLKTQSTEVDTVSGATYSSKGILGAIQNALKQAEKVTNGETIEEKADTTQLEEAIKTAEALVQEEYTEASWSVLAVRLQDAKEILETAGQTSVKQETVDKAVENLNLAVAQLEKKKSDQEEEVKTKYIDGTYEVSVPCKPDEDEDFTEYQLSMKVTIRNDKIVSITDVSGDGDAANDSYIKKAANGTSSKKGVVSQIITKGMPEEIDTVSRATCSSNAIIDGCKKALEMALRPEETEAQ
ncbi:MAG: FMN-binding protein [Mediterraneibacter faecis]